MNVVFLRSLDLAHGVQILEPVAVEARERGLKDPVELLRGLELSLAPADAQDSDIEVPLVQLEDLVPLFELGDRRQPESLLNLPDLTQRFLVQVD